jgi:hypothetical protein
VLAEHPIQWVKRPGRGVDHPPPFSAEVKETVELYLYSPSGTSWIVTFVTCHLLYYNSHRKLHTVSDEPSRSQRFPCSRFVTAVTAVGSARRVGSLSLLDVREVFYLATSDRT